MNKEQITQELSKYNITDALITELKQKYSGLTIKGLDDKEGYKLVHEARMDLKDKRAEALKPDKEKIAAFVQSIQALQFPSVKHEDAKKLMANFKTCLDKCCESIINESKNL